MFRAAFYVVTYLSTSNHPEEPYRALVLSRIESVKVYVICIHYLIVSSPHAVRPTILSFAFE